MLGFELCENKKRNVMSKSLLENFTGEIVLSVFSAIQNSFWQIPLTAWCDHPSENKIFVNDSDPLIFPKKMVEATKATKYNTSRKE